MNMWAAAATVAWLAASSAVFVGWALADGVGVPARAIVVGAAVAPGVIIAALFSERFSVWRLAGLTVGSGILFIAEPTAVGALIAILVVPIGCLDLTRRGVRSRLHSLQQSSILAAGGLVATGLAVGFAIAVTDSVAAVTDVATLLALYGVVLAVSWRMSGVRAP